jgi:hypothetical protein
MVKQECRNCIIANLKRTAKPKASNGYSPKRVGKIVHIDLFGPTRTKSIDGHKYFMFIVDGFSGYVTVKLLAQKNQAGKEIKNYVLTIERQIGEKVRVVKGISKSKYW